MPEPACAGTSIWQYQNNGWVCTQNNCSGECSSGKTCTPVMARRDPSKMDARTLAILDNPQEGETVEGGCSCQ